MFDIGKLIDFPKFFVDQAIALLLAILVISYVNPTTRGGVLVLGAVVIVTVNAIVVLGRLVRGGLTRLKQFRIRIVPKPAASVPAAADAADSGQRRDGAAAAPTPTPSEPQTNESPSGQAEVDSVKKPAEGMSPAMGQV
jgi:hypothetical protein